MAEVAISPEAEEVLSRLSEQVTEEQVEQVKAEEKTDAPADKGEKANDQPYRVFSSKEEHDEYMKQAFKDRMSSVEKRAEREKAEAERLAAEKALAENQKFEELAERRGTELETARKRIEELEGHEQEVQTYKDLVNNSVASRLENLNLPKGVASLLENMSPADKQKWLDENEADFAGATATVEAGSEGEEAGPSAEEEEAARQEFGGAILSGF